MNEDENNVIPGGSRLSLKPKEFHEPDVVKKPNAPQKKHRARKRNLSRKKPAKASKKITLRFLGQSVGSFLIGGLVLGFFLYHQATGMEWLTPEQANLARAIAIASFVAVLIIEAFTEDMMQGILCFFLTPYSFVYGLFFADAGPIRGLTMAILLFFGAEIYFTPENALIPRMARTIDSWIQSGQDTLIQPDGRPDAGY